MLTLMLPPPDSVPIVLELPPRSVCSRDDDALRDAAFDHVGAERARVEIDETFVHHGGAFAEVRAETDARRIGDADAARDHVVGHARKLVERMHRELAAGAARRNQRSLELARRRSRRRSSTPTFGSCAKMPSRFSVFGNARRCDSSCSLKYASTVD